MCGGPFVNELDLMSVSNTEPRPEEQNSEKGMGRTKRQKMQSRR